MVQLVRRCVDHPGYHFVAVYGVSKNLRSRLDNTNVKFLGYRPQDDSKVFAAEIFASGAKEDEIAALFHGAHYCPMEFTGDASQIDEARCFGSAPRQCAVLHTITQSVQSINCGGACHAAGVWD